MKPTVTETMARSFVAFRDHDLDAVLQTKAKLCLKDFLAGALTSTDLPWVKQAHAVAALDASTAASLIGSTTRASADNAAFANAVAGHGLVRDDMHLGSVSHLGVVVVPAVLAQSETQLVSGRALLTAIVIGYEAGGKLGRAVMDSAVARIHRPTGTVGPFAAAAALASLARLDATNFAAALGLAANLASGYNEWAASGATEMFFHPGFAARNALLAARLAGTGAAVSTTALEGDAGMLAAFGKDYPENLATPFADRAEILEVFFKEVPACNYAQTAAQAARSLASDEVIAGDDIAEVVVRVPQAAASYPGCDVSGPIESILQAKMSIQYNVAAALLSGHFDETNYVPATQPEFCRLAQRIVIQVDDKLSRAYPDRQGAEVAVCTTDGRQLSRQLANVAPASAATVTDRFLAAAESRFGPERAAALGATIDSLETLADAGRLVAACAA